MSVAKSEMACVASIARLEPDNFTRTDMT